MEIKRVLELKILISRAHFQALNSTNRDASIQETNQKLQELDQEEKRLKEFFKDSLKLLNLLFIG